MQQRRRFKQMESLEQRLEAEAARLREEARLLPHGVVREQVLQKLRQTETASHLTGWLNSPGLKSPT